MIPADIARPAFTIRAASDRIEGRLRAGQPMTIGILLRYRNEADVRALVRMQADRRSPLFKHFLSRAQWNAAFAPDPATVAQTLRTLQRDGFRVRFLANNRDFALLDTTAGAVEREFSTELRTVVRDGRRGFSNVRPASLPAALRETVAGISGLTNFPAELPPHRRPFATFATPPLRRAAATAAPSATPSPKPFSTATPQANPSPEPALATAPSDIENGLGNGYGPSVYAIDYDFPVMHGYAGRGRTFADIVGSDYTESDLTAFLNANGITRGGTTTRVLVDGGPGPVDGTQPAYLEAQTDVEVVAGLAPDANYYAYEFPLTSYDYQVEDSYNQAVDDDVADVVSSSFGQCEYFDPAMEYAQGYIAMQGAAKGMTFVAATGDFGGLQCYIIAQGMAVNSIVSPAIPSADVYFTAVGGTELVANPQTGAFVSEVGLPLSGGGTSNYEAVPDWQAGIAGVSTAGRNVPDLSMMAAEVPGYEVYFDGSSNPGGGTSIATPAVGAMIVEIDEIQNTRNGWINPRLYQILSGQGYAWAFRDITTGANAVATAGTGYDRVTGIGVPLGWELASEL